MEQSTRRGFVRATDAERGERGRRGSRRGERQLQTGPVFRTTRAALGGGGDPSTGARRGAVTGRGGDPDGSRDCHGDLQGEAGRRGPRDGWAARGSRG